MKNDNVINILYNRFKSIIYNNIKFNLSVFLLFTALTFIIYSNTFNSPFELDDNKCITENKLTTNLGNFTSLKTYINGFPTNRVISYLTLSINYTLGQDNVVGYHIINIIIHILTGFIAFLLLKNILSLSKIEKYTSGNNKIIISLLVGILFIVHPIQTNAVTYIVQRMASLCALFYLLSIYIYSNGRIQHLSKGLNYKAIILYLLFIISALFAILSKENAATLPFIIILFEAYFIRDKKGEVNKRMIYIPLILIGLAIFVIIISGHFPQSEAGTVSRIDYLITQFRVFLKYFQLLLFPFNLSIEYDYVASQNFGGMELLGLILILMILYLGYWSYKTNKVLSFGIFFFYIAMIVESSIIPILDVIFEHRLYLPMFGYSIVFVLLLWNLFASNNLRNTVIGILVILTLYAGLTYSRNEIWKTSLTLMEDVYKKYPENCRANNNYGLALNNAKRFDEAKLVLEKAIKLDSTYYRAYHNIGNTYLNLKEYEKAAWAYKRCVQLNPASYESLGKWIAYVQQQIGQKTGNDEFYKSEIEKNPQSAEAYHNYGMYLHNIIRYDEALIMYKKTIEFDANHKFAYNNIGRLLLEQKKYSDALPYLQKAVEINPNAAEIFNDLGRVYYGLGNIADAKTAWLKALELDPNYQFAINNLKLVK